MERVQVNEKVGNEKDGTAMFEAIFAKLRHAMFDEI